MTLRSLALHPFWLVLIRRPDRTDHQRGDGVEGWELVRLDQLKVVVVGLDGQQQRGLLDGADAGQQAGRFGLVVPLPPEAGWVERVGDELAEGVRHATSYAVGRVASPERQGAPLGGRRVRPLAAWARSRPARCRRRGSALRGPGRSVPADPGSATAPTAPRPGPPAPPPPRSSSSVLSTWSAPALATTPAAPPTPAVPTRSAGTGTCGPAGDPAGSLLPPGRREPAVSRPRHRPQADRAARGRELGEPALLRGPIRGVVVVHCERQQGGQLRPQLEVVEGDHEAPVDVGVSHGGSPSAH